MTSRQIVRTYRQRQTDESERGNPPVVLSAVVDTLSRRPARMPAAGEDCLTSQGAG